MQATGSGSSTRQVASGPPVASDVLTVGAAPHAEDIGLDPVGAEHRVRRFASFVSVLRDAERSGQRSRPSLIAPILATGRRSQILLCDKEV